MRLLACTCHTMFHPSSFPSRLEGLAFLLSVFFFVQSPWNVLLGGSNVVSRQVLNQVLLLAYRWVVDNCESILRLPQDGHGAESRVVRVLQAASKCVSICDPAVQIFPPASFHLFK